MAVSEYHRTGLHIRNYSVRHHKLRLQNVTNIFKAQCQTASAIIRQITDRFKEFKISMTNDDNEYYITPLRKSN